MLRASQLYQTNARIVYRQHAGLWIAKRLESTTTTAKTTTTTPTMATNTTATKRSGSIGKKLVGWTIVGCGIYGGVVYYALNDQDFRRTFTTHIPGASEFVAFLEVALADNELGHVEEYWNLAKDYGYKTVDAASNVYGYANDTYAKLTGASESPKLKTTTTGTSTNDSPPSTIVSKLSGHKNTHNGVLTSDKDAGTSPTITTTAGRPPLIIVRRTTSEHAVVRELSQVLTELASILNDAGLANAGRDILTQAELQIQQLNTRYQELDKDHADVLHRVQQLKQKADDMGRGLDRLYNNTRTVLNNTHTATGHKLLAKETQIKEESVRARQQIERSFSEFLMTELGALNQKLEQERGQALSGQATELKSLFIRDIKMLVERERARRLATLDNIAQRLQSLETSSFANAKALDHARQTHQLYVALSAVQDAVNAHHKQPFMNEWEVLLQSVHHDEGLKRILASVPRETLEQGVASVPELSSRFDVVADQVRRVAVVPENGGFGAHILSFVMSKLLFKKHGLVEGNDVEAVLARSSYYLGKKDLENATRELNQLQGWPKRLAVDWIASARKHLEVKQALEIIESHVILSSLADASI